MLAENETIDFLLYCVQPARKTNVSFYHNVCISPPLPTVSIEVAYSRFSSERYTQTILKLPVWDDQIPPASE